MVDTPEIRMIRHARPVIDAAAIAAVTRALGAGSLAAGAEVRRLEHLLGEFFPGREAVAVSSGTAALALALVALDIGPGRRVAIPAYACRSLQAAVEYAGAEAVCADVAERDVCLSPRTVRSAGAVHAVIAPHLFGFTADIRGLCEMGVPVIEDCAQSIGGHDDAGQLLGMTGDLSVLSFYATKLAPGGEGGACLVRDAVMAERIRSLRDCDRAGAPARAFNFKMSDLHAALTITQLERLPANLRRRSDLAERYDAAFGPLAWRNVSRRRQSVCFRYLVEAPAGRLPAVLAAAAAAGIDCRRPVAEPLHLQIGGLCPRADARHARLLSVPLYPGLDDAEAARVCAEIPRILKEQVDG